MLLSLLSWNSIYIFIPLTFCSRRVPSFPFFFFLQPLFSHLFFPSLPSLSWFAPWHAGFPQDYCSAQFSSWFPVHPCCFGAAHGFFYSTDYFLIECTCSLMYLSCPVLFTCCQQPASCFCKSAHCYFCCRPWTWYRDLNYGFEEDFLTTYCMILDPLDSIGFLYQQKDWPHSLTFLPCVLLWRH